MTPSPLFSLITSFGADAGDNLSWVTHAVAGTIPGVDYASISVLGQDSQLSTVGATDPLALKADSLQSELDGGPCADAALGTAVVQSYDVVNDPRWPQYGARVAELGLRGQTALTVQAGTLRLGSLNLYSTQPGVLSLDQLVLARGYAAQAATGMLLSRRVETLNDALRSRSVISQAIGLVMERYSLDQERAFDYLVRASQTSNVKLRQVAREIVEQATVSI